ncbi:DoxX family protein [Paraglaciecola sp.]|uniref:HvfX family Cu-binding RiPP maturation protein n=1 Tax=Paraglaciecola sp. TaxID=1920173 RepID=UPI0030F4AD8F
MKMLGLYRYLHNYLDKTLFLEGIAPLLFRLYLAPIMVQAGYNKLCAFENTVDWFGNAEYGLGLPYPMLMVSFAIAAELIGGLLLVIGLATRWVSIPLMLTMVVAIFTVHWPNGWAAIADSSSWLSDGTLWLNEAVMSSPEKLTVAKNILTEHGNYAWLTSSGKFVVLNGGIEFAVTYFIMLLSLFFTGGGKFTSVDYFLAQKLLK